MTEEGKKKVSVMSHLVSPPNSKTIITSTSSTPSNTGNFNYNSVSPHHNQSSQSHPPKNIITLFILVSTILAFLYYYSSSMDNQFFLSNISNSKSSNSGTLKYGVTEMTKGTAAGTAAGAGTNTAGNNKAYKPFNKTNPHKKSWCPYATCQNSPICTPCNRRYILILATGRSGSTTVLKMLNYLPNVRLSGENRNFIGISSTLISNFQRKEGEQIMGKQVSPLLNQNFDRNEGAYAHNAIPPQAMSCPIQHALNVLNPPPKAVQENDHLLSIQEYDKETIMGCKTIRFHKNNFSVQYASTYLKEVFPCSKIVVNIRTNVTNQLSSIQGTFKTATSTGKSADDIDTYNQFLIDLAKDLGSDMAKIIDLSEWKDNVQVFNDVVQWLGFRNCNFTQIVHENLNGYGRDHESNVGLDESKCHYPY